MKDDIWEVAYMISGKSCVCVCIYMNTHTLVVVVVGVSSQHFSLAWDLTHTHI